MTRTYLITGASRGIGAACAKLAGAEGANVVVNYVANSTAANDVVTAVEAVGGKAIAVQGDMSKEADILAVFSACDEAFSKPDVVINNAGTVATEGRLDTMDGDRISRIIDLNTTGAIIVAREAVKAMSTKHGGKGGALVNISSKAALLGSPNTYIDYASAKGAIDTLTWGLAQEVAREGIRVNGIRPGLIDTDIHSAGGNPDRAAKLGDTVPMGRAGTAEEVAKAILWLASDDASYVTGSTLDVAGGR
ncbi:SDR family oxidoreductase [Ahrensia sp. R2A130]|uniref:SDR family oxidoreductase n=1 Tax=Ahrensia sp. R2A130 TaxID=744979 RepID=UPI0001E0842C|nr:SDR family oxidoreductase [Ahrensia sp. R2A130]EFL88071.1 glucose 1-dehydrogenase [Ahrensia sp. R2A130]